MALTTTNTIYDVASERDAVLCFISSWRRRWRRRLTVLKQTICNALREKSTIGRHLRGHFREIIWNTLRKQKSILFQVILVFQILDKSSGIGKLHCQVIDIK